MVQQVWVWVVLVLGFSSSIFCGTVALAGAPFYDSFDDLDHQDGNPVTWSRYPAPFDGGTVESVNGDLVITPGDTQIPGFNQYFETDMVVEDRLYHDVDIHVVARALGPELSVFGVGALDTFFTSGSSGIALAGYVRSDLKELGMNLITDDVPEGLDRATLSFGQYAGDVHLRLRVQGDVATLAAWQDGNAEPAPQITVALPNSLTGIQGRVVIFAGSSTTKVSTAFRSVTVVPEPAAPVLAGMLFLLPALRRGRGGRRSSSGAAT